MFVGGRVVRYEEEDCDGCNNGCNVFNDLGSVRIVF